VATFNPTRVFPAPGTPVTKQIIFFWFTLENSIISAIAVEVFSKFFAPASLRVISSTEWLLYSETAASIIVGVGE
jgi:hypothetical protein